MTLVQPDSTLIAIRKKIRRLTASSSEQSLTTADIDQAINTFYQQDFPYAIKLDQMRSVYTFFTSPNVDVYPMNINFNQGIRAPVYFEGVQGYLFKDRDQFYNMWPRCPTLNQTSSIFITGTITSMAYAPTFISIGTPNSENLTIGQIVILNNIVGPTSLNGNAFTILNVIPGSFAISVDTTLLPNYVSGGDFTTTNQSLIFTVPNTPFLANSFVLGGQDQAGNPIKVTDDGNGVLVLVHQNGIASHTHGNPPFINSLPGMVNENLSGFVAYQSQAYQAYPGDQINTIIGSINYVTGQVVILFNLANVTPSTTNPTFEYWVSQYTVGRPYTLLFWNNHFEVRPVPDRVYKVEVETYLTPVQFLETTDVPIVNQWWQYIAYGVAMEILRERNDTDGVESLREGFMRQEGLVLERQGVEEIGQRNTTIFSGSVQGQGWNQGGGWPY